MAKSSIVATSKKFTVSEGNPAVAQFSMSAPLDAAAQVAVRLTGVGASKGRDYDGFSYSFDGIDWTTLSSFSGLVTLPKGTTQLYLRTQIKGDLLAAETNESLVFSVAQAPSASKVLENSYWVTSTANIKETLSLSTIKATNDGQSFNEGEHAVGRFTLNRALAGEAIVAVGVEGHSATVGEDTAGALEYRLDASPTWTPVPQNGRITLPSGTASFDLRVQTLNDLSSEPAEQLNFKVAQVRGNLSNSYYVNSVVNIEDLPYNPFQATPAIDTLTGTTGQDVFDLLKAQSKPFANKFDTINQFGQGDRLTLPDTIQPWSIGVITAQELTELSNPTESDVLEALNEVWYDEYLPNGQGSLLKIEFNSNTVYLLADTNANGLFDTRERAGETPDAFFKIIGTNVSDLITGESILTEADGGAITTQHAPTISGVPSTAQSVVTSVAAALADFTVADPDSSTLTVSLTASNGTLNNLTDADPTAAGIQLVGTAANINAAIAGATFTAAAPGAASIGLSVTDGTTTPATATYKLTAVTPADTTPPTVTNVAITAATGAQNSTLNAGDVLSITVTMNEATTVTGTPKLALNIGSATVQANYASGSGTTALVFTYTVQPGQTDANGISFAANSLSMNGGTIKDTAGNNATLTHAAVADNAGYKVDNTAPVATLIAPTATSSMVQLEAIGNTNGYDRSPQITAVGSSGEYVVTWFGQDSARDPSIFVQKFNANGTTTGQSPVQLEAIGYADGNDRSPQITVVGSSGEYVVTWQGEDRTGDDSIFVQKFNANGTTTSQTPVQLEAVGSTKGDDEAPQITAVGSSGEYVVTWSGRDSVGGDTSIFVQKFNADGTPAHQTPVQLEPIGKTNGSDQAPQVTAVGSSGEYVVTWQGQDSTGDTRACHQSSVAEVSNQAAIRPG